MNQRSQTAEIERITHSYLSRYPEDAQTINELLALIETGADVCSRKEFHGHVTCGAVLMTLDQRFLMIHHRNLDRWLLPGGHLEPEDPTLRHAALRELVEETGFEANTLITFGNWLDELPFDVDCHFIPANPSKGEPEHRHWDFRFLIQSDREANMIQPDEIVDLGYFGISRLPNKLANRLKQLSIIE